MVLLSAATLVPASSLVPQQSIRLRGAPASWLVEGQRRRAWHIPTGRDGINEMPRHLNLIGSSKQRGVSLHCVQQQTLVGIRQGAGPEVHGVVECHVHRTRPHASARFFGLESQMYSLIGLEAQ